MSHGDAALIVATQPHRDALLAALQARGCDTRSAIRESRLVARDARETVDTFMLDGLDPELFHETLSVAMDEAGADARGLRVYGEIVSLLWADGDVGSALAVEGLWSRLVARRGFTLISVYPLVEQLVAGLRKGSIVAASAVINAALSDGLSAEAVLARLVAPAMHMIGAMWEHGSVSVADEHLATATCERALQQLLYPAIVGDRPASGECVLVAGVEGDRHPLGARMVAHVLEGHGHRVVDLGVDTPAEALAQAIRRHEPDLIALSITLPAASQALEDSLAAALAVAPDTPILLGGQGVDPGLARRGFTVAGTVESAPVLVEALLRDRSGEATDSVEQARLDPLTNRPETPSLGWATTRSAS